MNLFREYQEPRRASLTPAPGQLFHFLDRQCPLLAESFHIPAILLMLGFRAEGKPCKDVTGCVAQEVLNSCHTPCPVPFALRVALFFSFTTGPGPCSPEKVNSPYFPLQTVPHQASQHLPSVFSHFLLTPPALYSLRAEQL